MISLVLGLGNIGEKYRQTRHNVGFEVVNRLVNKHGVAKPHSTDDYDWALAEYEDRQFVLAKPRTYVNLSGVAALDLLHNMDISPTEMLVVVDDFNLPLGALRFRTKGSDGGHNGLKSLIEVLGTRRFPRLRMGIGSPNGNGETADFVLSPFESSELSAVEEMYKTATEAVEFAVSHRLDLAMSKYNSTPALPE